MTFVPKRVLLKGLLNLRHSNELEIEMNLDGNKPENFLSFLIIANFVLQRLLT